MTKPSNKKRKLEEDKEEEITSFVTCEDCGNVWDGYAQCNCEIYLLGSENETKN